MKNAQTRQILAALLGMAMLLASTPALAGGLRFWDVMSDDDIKWCKFANQRVSMIAAEQNNKSWWYSYLDFDGPAQKETDYRAFARIEMIGKSLSEDERRQLATACNAVKALDSKGLKKLKRFKNPFASRLDIATLDRMEAEQKAKWDPVFAKAAASAPAPATPSTQSWSAPQVDPLTQQCEAILKTGIDDATTRMMRARKQVDNWLRSGAIGSAYGSEEVRGGCHAIGNAINRARMAQCPSSYADALERFRNDYYIGFPSGSRFDCN